MSLSSLSVLVFPQEKIDKEEKTGKLPDIVKIKYGECKLLQTIKLITLYI